MRWLGGVGSGGIVFAALMMTSEDWPVGLALVTGAVVLSLVVQTVLLRRHNDQLAQRP
jgi:hypothetical protein